MTAYPGGDGNYAGWCSVRDLSLHKQRDSIPVCRRSCAMHNGACANLTKHRYLISLLSLPLLNTEANTPSRKLGAALRRSAKHSR